MEEKLKELLEIKEYFNNLGSTLDGYLGNAPKIEVTNRMVRDIFTSTLTTRMGHISANGHFTSLERMQLLPAAYGGEDNVNKFARVKEITTEWIDYKDAWLSNASTKAFITVALDNTGNVVITKTDPYADL